MKILFICKHNEAYGFKVYHRRSAGLYNSTKFIVETLNTNDIPAEIEEAVDNNDIDRLTTQAFKGTGADVVILEALWVVPEKFDILKKLHPKVKWFCHLHSDMPFLALEGIAIDWIKRYAIAGVGLIANSKYSYNALRVILTEAQVIYLPNVYLGKMRKKCSISSESSINIACLGAIRPMKNHLLQAMAAIKFSREIEKRLYFYVNASRVEVGGEPVLKNLRALFSDPTGPVLIEKEWMTPEQMLDFCQKMDIGMQVSLTETFNVVSADYVTAGLPIVVSKEVKWASGFCKADEDSVDDIVRIMKRVYRCKTLVRLNQLRLWMNSNAAQKMWVNFCR